MGKPHHRTGDRAPEVRGADEAHTDEPVTPQTWQDKFDAVRACAAALGRLPRQRDTWHGWAAGKWLMHQQQRRDSLTTDGARALDELLNQYPPSGREQKWAWMRDMIVRYQRQFGEIPIKGATWHGQPVGQWVRDRRKEYHRGELSSERVASLEAVPGWVWDAEQADFDTGLRHFRAYVETYGIGWVPMRYLSPDGYPLGSWCRDRRRRWDSLRPANQRALHDAGFSFARTDDVALPNSDAATPVPGTRRGRSVAATRAAGTTAGTGTGNRAVTGAPSPRPTRRKSAAAMADAGTGDGARRRSGKA